MTQAQRTGPNGAALVGGRSSGAATTALSRRAALRAQIEGVRVAEGERGTGLGAHLLQWAFDWARAQGCALAQLTADKARTDAHRFYERLGFVATHEGYKRPL